MKEIKITISKDGSEVDVEGDGFIGSGCMEYGKRIQVALGDTKDEKRKPEFFQGNSAGISVG